MDRPDNAFRRPGQWSITMLAVVAPLLSPYGADAQSRPQASPRALLTVTQAVEEALRANAILLDASDAVERARIEAVVSGAAFRPQIGTDMYGSFGSSDLTNQRYGVSATELLPAGTEFRAAVGSVTSRNQLGTFYASDAYFGVTQPLFRGLAGSSARRGVSAAAAAVREAAWHLDEERQRIVVETAAAYFDVAAAERLSAVARSGVDRAEKLEAASAAKLQAGRVSQLDVLRARQLVDAAQSQAIDAGTAAEDARDRLRELTGRRSAEPFAVSDDIDTAVDDIRDDEAIAAARSHRPEVRSADQAIEQARLEAAFARAQLRPEVSVSVAATRSAVAPTLAASLGADDFHASAFASVAMPFNRTREAAAYQSALIGIRGRERERDQTVLRIDRDVRRAVREHARAARILHLASDAAALARQELDVATLRFERGLANNLDVVSAEGALRAAEARRLGAMAAVAVTRLRLHAAMGTIDPATEFTSTSDRAVVPPAPAGPTK